MATTKRPLVGEHVHAGIDEAAARGRMVLIPSEEELAEGQTNRIQRRAWKKIQKGKVRK